MKNNQITTIAINKYLYIQEVEIIPLKHTEKVWGFSIDFPSKKTAVYQHLVICGWILGNQCPVVSVEVIFESQVIGTTNVNLLRTDIPKLYPEAQGKWINNSGFSMAVEIKEIESVSEIIIQAVLEDKTVITLAQVQCSNKNKDELLKSDLDLTAQTLQVQRMRSLNRLEEALLDCEIVNCYHSEPPAIFYLIYGDTLRLNNQFNQAILVYQKAAELIPDSPYPPLHIGTCYFNISEFNLAIENYQKAIKLYPDLPFAHYKFLAHILRLQGQEEEANTWLNSAPLPKDGEIYGKIWQALNETNLENLEAENANYPDVINQNKAEQYFAQTSDYKIIYLLQTLSKEDQQLLESSGLSLEYLKLNQARLITSTGVSSQEPQKPSKLQQLDPTQKGLFIDTASRTDYQISTLEENYIHLICPYTGELLSSNRSFTLFSGQSFCYRFVGKEVFYLMTGFQRNMQFVLYFPQTDLIIYHKTNPGQQEVTECVNRINTWKARFVTSWQQNKTYLLNQNKAKIVALVGFNFMSTAEHIQNDLSGIGKLNEAGLLHKIDKFLVIAQEFYGGIDEIYPEIPAEKVQRLQPWQEEQETLKNNYFITRFSDAWVTEDLANRICQLSYKKCSPNFLATVEESQQKHFPLLWITFRLGKRTWISQVEGIANLIKSLAEKFPNLGVIFDGSSRIDIKGKLLVNNGLERILKKEKETLREIQALLPSQIKTYDLIGRPIYETIVWAKAMDLYFAPFGGGLAKIISIANKPGLVHSNFYNINDFLSNGYDLYSLRRENPVIPVYIPSQYITEATDDHFSKYHSVERSYECDWRGAYQELLKIISSLSTSRETEKTLPGQS